MRLKGSVPPNARRTIDKRIPEGAARKFPARRARAAREARDLRILNEAADALNREVEDVLAYQAEYSKRSDFYRVRRPG